MPVHNTTASSSSTTTTTTTTTTDRYTHTHTHPPSRLHSLPASHHTTPHQSASKAETTWYRLWHSGTHSIVEQYACTQHHQTSTNRRLASLYHDTCNTIANPCTSIMATASTYTRTGRHPGKGTHSHTHHVVHPVTRHQHQGQLLGIEVGGWRSVSLAPPLPHHPRCLHPPAQTAT